MRAAVFAQPDWLAGVPSDRRLPPGRYAAVGCGTSFHAAQTSGHGVQALDAVIAPPEADLLVLVSHEGGTQLTVEAARAFAGPKWLVTGKAESPLAALCDEVVVCTPRLEESYCHTASYTCAVAALAALRGEDIAWLAEAVAAELSAERLPVSSHERWLVAGTGRDWPTAQEAALKLREGAQLATEAHRTEELLHGHLAAIDEHVRCFVLEGEGRAAERASRRRRGARGPRLRRDARADAAPRRRHRARSSCSRSTWPSCAASTPIRSAATTRAGSGRARPTPSPGRSSSR